ncbi:MAG: tRNA dihydrouridine synthase DusB [Mariniphaga sp.]|jgi:nifR3 family TIM-barrel protein|nr:tRNA dihydrouridine synthase DusB [Mariniphaga sp.]
MHIGKLDLGLHPLMLAPMEDISDPPFRLLCRELGADVVFTEFIASEGLARDVAGSLKKLDFIEAERPIGIQLFGNTVPAMVNAALVARQHNPDFIDLNFGCPVRKIVNKGGGAALLRDIPLLLQLTRAVVQAVDCPVTVKTRLGWDEHSKPIVELAVRLQDVGISALTIHGRTRAQAYSGTADWTLIGEVKRHPDITIPIIGNGDVIDGPSAKRMIEIMGVDGIMIGRASIGNPWIFREIKHFLATGQTADLPSVNDRVALVSRHLTNSLAWHGSKTALFEMRKHYGRYFKGSFDFKPFKMRLMQSTDQEELLGILEEIATRYPED